MAWVGSRSALTLNTGQWNAGSTVSYVWKRDGIVLDTQPVGLKYIPLADEDMGLRMSATVTVTKQGFYDAIVDTASTAVMNGKPIQPVLAIVDTTGPNNTPVDGNTLSYSIAGTNPASGVVVATKTWKVGTRVVGTGTSYVVHTADIGKKISLTVTLTAPNWGSVTKVVTTPIVIAGGR